jgi:hypothetical protein
MKKIKNIIPIGFGFLFLSCSSKMEIPAYIYIEKVNFYVTDFNIQGTASFKIPDIWVTVNGKSIGTYQLPALIPVIASGNTELIFEAGIKLNGWSDWRSNHPIFEFHKENINLTKGKIDTVFPKFTYENYVKFALIEDFDNPGLNFYSIEGSAKLEITDDPNLLFHYPNEPNKYSGIIELPFSDTIYFFEIKSKELKLNSNTAMDCLVELNCRFDANVEIGMYCYFSNSSIRTQRISIANIVGKSNNTEWNKIYANLEQERLAALSKGMTHFEIYMRCGIPKYSTARFLFDNIKVVYH